MPLLGVPSAALRYFPKAGEAHELRTQHRVRLFGHCTNTGCAMGNTCRSHCTVSSPGNDHHNPLHAHVPLDAIAL